MPSDTNEDRADLMADEYCEAHYDNLSPRQQIEWLTYREGALAGLTALRPAGAKEAGKGFHPMTEWDNRDEPVLLMVDYRSDGEFALGDAYLSVTIGHNSDHNVPPNEAQGWQFAGWDNSHECYTQGKGLPIGWRPLPEASFTTQLEITSPKSERMTNDR